MIIRDTLTADRTYYVRTDGNDNNSGLANTATEAFLTIQKAVDVVCNTIDNMGFNITIQVADGSYNAPVVLKNYIGSGLVTLSGNPTTPANVSITTAACCITARSTNCPWTIAGLKVSSTGIHGFDFQDVGINLSAIEFGTCASYHIFANMNAAITISSNYKISGNAAVHLFAASNAVIYTTGHTLTITGTPNFSTAFAFAMNFGQINITNMVFSGTATGSRYSVSKSSIIETNGGGANYLPGNAAGFVATQGQYF